MKRIKTDGDMIVLAIMACAALLVGGCAGTTNLNSTVFQTESLVADTSVAATHTINVYVDEQTNPPASLISAQKQIWAADVQISQGLKLTEALRQEYELSPNTTNAAALGIALLAVQTEQTNISAMVNSAVTSTNQ